MGDLEKGSLPTGMNVVTVQSVPGSNESLPEPTVNVSTLYELDDNTNGAFHSLNSVLNLDELGIVFRKFSWLCRKIILFYHRQLLELESQHRNDVRLLLQPGEIEKLETCLGKYGTLYFTPSFVLIL